MYKIVICDDDPYFLNISSKLLVSYIKENKMTVHLTRYIEAGFLLNDIQNKIFYDIYILDIRMSQYLGTDIAKKIHEYSSEPIIIFLTSYCQYALESFEIGIFRYIHKASFKQQLPLAVHAAVAKLELQDGKYYLLCNSRGSQKIFFNKILYLYKEGKNTIFVLFDDQIKIRKPLFEVYKELEKTDFIQVDRCYIVNLQYIHKVDNNEGKLTLKNNIILNVSKSRMREIKDIVSKFWGSKI